MKNYYVETLTPSLSSHGMEFFIQRPTRGSVVVNDHIHEQLEFLYIVDGEFLASVNDGEYLLRKGDIFFVRSNNVHRILAQNAPEFSYYVLKLNLSVVFDLANEKNAADYVLRLVLDRGGEKTHWVSTEPDALPIARAFESLIAEYTSNNACRDMAMKLHASAVALETLKSIIAHEEPRDESNKEESSSLTAQIYKVIMHINRHYFEQIDAEDCAKMANMSYSYFSRSFKRITGRSFKEYLNFVRVSHADRLLYAGDKGITDIAMECGYNNVSYFISVYKRIKGETPLKLRRRDDEK